MRTGFRNLLQPWIVVSAAIAIAVVTVAIVFISAGKKPEAAYVMPTQGGIEESVSTTGTVKAATSVDLSFQASGEIASVNADVGSHVSAGETLAVLSGSDLEAQLESAEAQVAAQQAKLAGIQAGATPETVQASQTAVTNAQNGLTQAKQSVIAAAQDAYAKSDDAIHNRVDQFINNPRSTSPTLEVAISNSQAQQDIVSKRVTLETLLSQWNAYVSSLPSDPNSADTDQIVATTRADLSQISSYLDEVSAGLSEAIPTTPYPQSAIQGYQASIAVARANISGAVTELNGAQTGVTTAQSGLASAQAQLTVTQSPARDSDVAAQQAAIDAAQAGVDLARAQLSKTVISAPISGTITVNNAKVGATAAPGTPLISMNSDSSFQMETYVSEADVAKVKVGQAATVSLDSYQSQAPFAARVISIDPAATVQNGVSSYKVTLQFDQNDSRISAGMTGNAIIATSDVSSALSVPESAIITAGTSTFVVVNRDGRDREVPVTTGISGNGMTQITSGLTAGDRLRTFGNAQ